MAMAMAALRKRTTDRPTDRPRISQAGQKECRSRKIWAQVSLAEIPRIGKRLTLERFQSRIHSAFNST